jgi:phytoene dehydrogenase-like protein
MKAIAIGSGLSGLTAEALLAKKGHSVIVLEQHERIGGVTGAMTGAGNVVEMILKESASKKTRQTFKSFSK